jgi:transcriptional regulator with XRE-family HTH domain
MLLPRGAVRLRCDLGEFLKRHRQGKLEGVAFGTQAQVAARVGITRQTLSDIERGAAWPGPATLDALLDVLELGWEHIAHAVETDAEPRNFVNDMPGGGRLARVPAEEAPRRHRNFLEGDTGNQTLVEAARRAGISAALLSRMERGQNWRSRVFAFVPATQSGDPPELIICNPWIARLCNGNGGEGD